MESTKFWGVEVKPGELLNVTVQFFRVLHISQVKNGKKVENICVKVLTNDKDFVVGTLSTKHASQIIVDLFFEDDFKLSHDWKDGSVFFCGYIADRPNIDIDKEDALYFNAKDEDEEEDCEDDSEEEEEKKEEVKPVKKPAEALKRHAKTAPKNPGPAKKRESNKTDGKKGGR